MNKDPLFITGHIMVPLGVTLMGLTQPEPNLGLMLAIVGLQALISAAYYRGWFR